ncbi:MAG: response regulator [Deltaproteobacteria bacterium]|nr:response regulator [Deltaproteobacteria bacterium]
MPSPKVLIVDDNQELLNLLARLFTDAGYQVVQASKGKAALDLAKADRPQLAVIDILLPDMMGYHLADAIRRESTIPVIFLTGVFKGGKHAGEAKTKYGAVGYFEKPFEANKLLETAKSVVKPNPQQEVGVDSFEVELDIDVEDERQQDPMELTGVVRISGGDNISAELRGAKLTAGASKAPVLVRPPPASYPTGPAPITEAERGIRRGELRDNLPQLINAFYQSQETGELGVHRGKVKKVVYFEKGQPVFAQSNLVTDRFGQFLVRVGKINEGQLKQAAAAAAASKRRTGDVLVEMGLLKETERLYYVGQQVKSIIYSLFGWEEGVYELAFKHSAQGESIKLDAHPANLIMRGIKKLYKPERLRRLLAPEDRVLPSLQPAYALSDVDLERWEAELLPRADGTRTVAELVAIAGRPEAVVHGFLYGLVALSVLERRA